MRDRDKNYKEIDFIWTGKNEEAAAVSFGGREMAVDWPASTRYAIAVAIPV